MGDYLGSVALPSMKMRQRKLCQIRQQPRAAPVYNDSSNFGVRMLEKLGWSEGKGLGKREDGMAAPILPKAKQDAEGFGYAGEKDDHWTQHDQDFNQLLKSLNGEEAPAESEVDLQKMKSLEEKSKNSRARVHYKKFTRGKDLSRASEKDLANIFGKKTLEEVKNRAVAAAEVEVDKGEQEDAQDTDEPNVLGLTTIKASMSLQDYFKSKMQEKLGLTKANPVIEQETVEQTEEVQTQFKKKSKKSKRSIDLDETVADLPAEEVVDNGEEISKKKKKKNKLKDEIVQELVEEQPEQEEPPKKKSKKEKRSKIAQEELSLDGTETNMKKSKKEKPQELEDDHPLEIEEPTEQPVKKKSKKDKRKRSDEELDSTVPLGQETEEIQASTSEEVPAEVSAEEGDAGIKKKNKKTEEEVAQTVQEEEITCRVKVSVLKQLDESGFPGSNFADIVGYGLFQEVKLIKRESHRKQNLEKHQFIRQKQTSFQRKRQSGVIASFASHLIKTVVRQPGLSLGASGAIMGVLGYVCSQYPDTQLSIVFLPMFTFSAGAAFKVIMGFDLAGVLLGWRVFDHAAHLGGALFGMFWAYYGSQRVWPLREHFVGYWHEWRGPPKK